MGLRAPAAFRFARPPLSNRSHVSFRLRRRPLQRPGRYRTGSHRRSRHHPWPSHPTRLHHRLQGPRPLFAACTSSLASPSAHCAPWPPTSPAALPWPTRASCSTNGATPRFPSCPQPPTLTPCLKKPTPPSSSATLHSSRSKSGKTASSAPRRARLPRPRPRVAHPHRPSLRLRRLGHCVRRTFGRMCCQ